MLDNVLVSFSSSSIDPSGRSRQLVAKSSGEQRLLQGTDSTASSVAVKSWAEEFSGLINQDG
ncbi:hypothetical protein EBAPG3_14905 [Nitrosospira lacus]|nr:hypothetical protein EBAPG3_14905 [Nitrosospira lacus]